MDKEKLEALIIDYIDGQLNEETRLSLEKELVENQDARQLYEQLRAVMEAINRSENFEPSVRLRTGFDKILQVESGKQTPARTIFFQPVFYRAAAALLLVAAGIGISYWINKNQRQEDQIAALQKEVAETKNMMMSLLDNQESASQRIQGVNVALNFPRADDEVANALIKTLNEDPNTNVRMAALDALSKFLLEPGIKKALIRSLGIQKDPVVQIALIQLMVKIKEKGVVKDLENIIEDSETIQAVRDEAYSGLLKLS